MHNIPIFFTFNNDYVEPAAVAFYSLLSKAKVDTFYDMYVVHSDISLEKQELLQNVIRKVAGKGKLTFIKHNNELISNWGPESFNLQVAGSKFTADTVVRCFASRFFPNLDKIIYSDVDVVFTDDISDLIDYDIQGKYMLGVLNPFMKHSKYELSHLSKDNYERLKDSYIGGGIWVMNLKKIRDDKLEDKMISIINDKSIFKRWNDQDIVNIAMGGGNNVGFIPLNLCSLPYMYDLLQDKNFISHYTRDELYNSILSPRIIHFAAIKPWKQETHYAELWWSYFDFLGLKPTKIMSLDRTPKKTELYNNYKKYRRLFNLSLITLSATFFLILLLSIINIF